MSGHPGPEAGLQSFNSPGQNRESGGEESEKTPYAAGQDCGDPNPSGSGPAS